MAKAYHTKRYLHGYINIKVFTDLKKKLQICQILIIIFQIKISRSNRQK